jgi:hypothetical protein
MVKIDTQAGRQRDRQIDKNVRQTKGWADRKIGRLADGQIDRLTHRQFESIAGNANQQNTNTQNKIYTKMGDNTNKRTHTHTHTHTRTHTYSYIHTFKYTYIHT